MHLSSSILALISFTALAVASPGAVPGAEQIAKRDVSFGNPDLVTDQGNRYKINYGSTDGHPNACPGSYICYIYKSGNPPEHGDVSLGDPDDMVDEGNRYRLNFGSTSGHPNACDGSYICYLPK